MRIFLRLFILSLFLSYNLLAPVAYASDSQNDEKPITVEDLTHKLTWTEKRLKYAEDDYKFWESYAHLNASVTFFSVLGLSASTILLIGAGGVAIMSAVGAGATATASTTVPLSVQISGFFQCFAMLFSASFMSAEILTGYLVLQMEDDGSLKAILQDEDGNIIDANKYDNFEACLAALAEERGFKLLPVLDQMIVKIYEIIDAERIAGNRPRLSKEEPGFLARYFKTEDTKYFIKMASLYDIQRQILKQKINILKKEIDNR